MATIKINATAVGSVPQRSWLGREQVGWGLNSIAMGGERAGAQRLCFRKNAGTPRPLLAQGLASGR